MGWISSLRGRASIRRVFLLHSTLQLDPTQFHSRRQEAVAHRHLDRRRRCFSGMTLLQSTRQASDSQTMSVCVSLLLRAVWRARYGGSRNESVLKWMLGSPAHIDKCAVVLFVASVTFDFCNEQHDPLVKSRAAYLNGLATMSSRGKTQTPQHSSPTTLSWVSGCVFCVLFDTTLLHTQNSRVIKTALVFSARPTRPSCSSRGA